LIAALAVSIPLAFRMAFLRGRKRFFKASLTDGIGSAAKLVLAPVFVLLGWRSLGAISGLALSQIVPLAFGMAWARQAGFHGFGLNAGGARLAALRPYLRHALAVLLASGCVAVLQTLDIVTIKHYFSPVQAGLYAGVTTVASIVFFLMAPITGVLVTSVSPGQPARKNRLQLKGSLALMAGLGGSALVVMALAPKLIIKILVGGKYLAYAHYLPRIGLVMLLLAAASAIMMYHVALKQYGYAAAAVVALGLSLGLIYLNHATILTVINDLLAGSAALLIIAAFADLVSQSKRREVNV
jgi:O-antigen/teichoic acid export membrane protein